MEFHVTGRHIEITAPIRDYAEEKLTRLPRYFDRVSSIEVVADKSDPKHFALEVIVHAEHTSPFIAKTSGDDLYACIDGAFDKLERQLTDHKSKLVDRKHGH